MCFRVGGKDQGTRFLSFVDAINGFRHLLKQEDLDRALSLCTGLRGQLRSKFLVLSDDRVLPPYQGKKGKRTHPGDDDDTRGASGKRHHQGNDNPNPTGPVPIPGVSVIHQQPSTSAYSYHQGLAAQTQVALTNVNFPPLGASQLAHVQVHGQVHQAIPTPSYSGVPSIGPPQAQPLPAQQVQPQIIPVVLSQPPPLLPSAGASFTVVKAKRTRRRPKPASKADGTTPTRLTPSRAAKVKVNKTASSSQPMDITSPTENYESCASTDDESNDIQEVQEVQD